MHVMHICSMSFCIPFWCLLVEDVAFSVYPFKYGVNSSAVWQAFNTSSLGGFISRFFAWLNCVTNLPNGSNITLGLVQYSTSYLT